MSGLLGLAAAGMAGQPAFGDVPDCDWLARRMEAQLALPAGLLASIARVETGRVQPDGSYKAWPWTINHAGKGLFFDSEKAALAYAEKHIETGDLNLDLGCMQISAKWHLSRFSDPAQMLDPVSNVAYAASFLEQLYDQHGSWDEAVRHYHTADRRQNGPYLQKVRAVWKNEPDTGKALAVAGDAAGPLPPAVVPVPSARPAGKRVRQLVSDLVAASEKPRPVIEDRQMQLEKKHPALHGQWDKVARFRNLLAEEG